MSELAIAPGLTLPADTPVQRIAFMGTSNSGKTYGATKLAEQMWDAGMQFVALDVMGIWYGLRIPDTGPAIPITIFGGKHQDIPITPDQGGQVADVIHKLGISAVIDISQFESDAAKVRFATAFADRLYWHRKDEPGMIHLFLEEAHEYLPQNIQAGETEMVHVWNRIWKQGGNFGIGGSIITQRPQDVSKKAVELSSVIFAYNVVGVNAVKAMKAWIGDEGDQLKALPQGDCLIYSPSWLCRDERVRFDPKRTFHTRFDPFADAGKQRENRPLTSIDVAALVAAFHVAAPEGSSSTKKIKPNSDAKFNQADLDRYAAEQVKLATAEAMAEIAIATKPYQDRIDHAEWIIGEAREIARGMVSVLEQALEFGERLNGILTLEAFIGNSAADDRSLEIPADLKLLAPAAKTKPPTPPTQAEGITGPQQRILDALASFEAVRVASPRREHVALFAEASPASSGYANNLGRLRTLGYIDYPEGGRVALTETGRPLANAPSMPLKLRDLHLRWLHYLPAPQGRILADLIAIYPDAKDKTAFANSIGVSPTSSGYANNLGRLRSLGLIDYPRPGFLVATDLLFPKGLK